MIVVPPSKEVRPLREERVAADLAIAGGGLAGTCAAITAARAGLKVVLAQDRPVLGGNASSEVRLWILGATAHMGNNNRWAREGGVVDEIVVENMHRNPEGNPVIVDSILLEKAVEEPNLTLLLNTAVYEVLKEAPDRIRAMRAFCSQNQTLYHIEAPLFCDASGDGIIAFLAGAAFRMGAENREEFGEGFTPTQEYGELLGHSMYFYSRDTGKPVEFIAPSFALKDITKLPKFHQLNATSSGCRLWWLEWGGRLDTVHDTEKIKWELWKVVYGVWDYIKNSGKFPDAKNLTLEWVAMIPGKRESRRFEGDYMLRQQDIVEQRRHADAVSYGGWAIDLHPADGVYSKLPSCTQWHSKGVYQIPYRCLYSRNIENLFLAGRIISVSHVAFGSTRVMGTCAESAQAVGVAAALCRERKLKPRDLSSGEPLRILQRNLLRAGQYIPGVRLEDPEDLVRSASITASSQMILDRLRPSSEMLPLKDSAAMLLPVPAGRVPAVSFYGDVAKPVKLRAELRASSRVGNYTPDLILAASEIDLTAGRDKVILCGFDASVSQPQYLFYCLMANPAVEMTLSDERLTGILCCINPVDKATGKGRTQDPPPESGIEKFELWTPRRRPAGRNLALSVNPPLRCFAPENVRNGFSRPYLGPNAWVASREDRTPKLTLRWPRPVQIRRIVIGFDTDFDHPMESVLMGHPERDMPFCVKHYRVLDAAGRVLHEKTGNHQSWNTIRFEKAVETAVLHLEVLATHGAPAAIFDLRCYAS